MKVITEVSEAEGLESLLGKKNVTLFCANYFYTGTLVGVNETCVKLKSPAIIYNTGEWSAPKWDDCQSMNIPHIYVQTNAIESFGETK